MNTYVKIQSRLQQPKPSLLHCHVKDLQLWRQTGAHRVQRARGTEQNPTKPEKQKTTQYQHT